MTAVVAEVWVSFQRQAFPCIGKKAGESEDGDTLHIPSHVFVGVFVFCRTMATVAAATAPAGLSLLVSVLR